MIAEIPQPVGIKTTIELLRDFPRQFLVDDLLKDLERLSADDGDAVDEKGGRRSHTQVGGEVKVGPDFFFEAPAFQAGVEIIQV